MKRSTPLPLSNMTGGVNRNDKLARRDQAIEALNVIEDEGDLRRRPAFRAVGTAAPHYIADVVVKHYDLVTTTWTTYSFGIGSPNPARVGGTPTSGLLLVGSAEKFDGIEIPFPLPPYPRPTGRRYLYPQIVRNNGFEDPTPDIPGSFRDIPWFLDTTLESIGGALTTRHTLYQPGRISWHRDDLPEWTDVELDGERLYWVALNLSDTPFADRGSRDYAAGLPPP